jgi:septal ring factor EnvC (AmiA/AmiB activator)
LIQQGKDSDSATLERLSADIKRERREHERALQDALGKVRDLEGQLAKLRGEQVEQRDLFSGQENEMKRRLNGALHEIFNRFN